MLIGRLFLCLAMFLGSAPLWAASICTSTACGTIVCSGGCIQRSVNGVCVANYCSSKIVNDQEELKLTSEEEFIGSDETFEVAPDAVEAHLNLGHCVSCADGCCHGGYSFHSAENACKQHHFGGFGCFTRCAP